jgi:glycosyltransferase involved in cell wall biosynthesis
MRILFYDAASPYLYCINTLRERAMGGAEATVIRIAHGLSRDHVVYVAQAKRNKNEEVEEQGVRYISLDSAHTLQPEVIILLREHLKLKNVGEYYPYAKKFFWVHNFPTKDLFYFKPDLAKYGYHIIAVSHYLRELIEKRLRGKWYQRWWRKPSAIKVSTIYNPIDDNLALDTTFVQPNKLLFLSAPYKGVNEVIASFQEVRKKFPEFKLYVAMPGHGQRDVTLNLQDGVEYLGALPHHEIIQHLRESFCVFYPQSVKAETFGLVYAEANAVGTPVLAHDFGSAREVLSDSSQLIDSRNVKQVIEKLAEWSVKRPVVQGKSEFKLSIVLQKWNDIFGMM